jgi:hypothetical protein
MQPKRFVLEVPVQLSAVMLLAHCPRVLPCQAQAINGHTALLLQLAPGQILAEQLQLHIPRLQHQPLLIQPEPTISLERLRYRVPTM